MTQLLPVAAPSQGPMAVSSRPARLTRNSCARLASEAPPFEMTLPLQEEAVQGCGAPWLRQKAQAYHAHSPSRPRAAPEAQAADDPLAKLWGQRARELVVKYVPAPGG